MGNKVGFEVEQGSVKIAVLCEKPEDVQFMDNLNSSNLKRRVPMKETACVTYFFKYSIDQFVQVLVGPSAAEAQRKHLQAAEALHPGAKQAQRRHLHEPGDVALH